MPMHCCVPLCTQRGYRDSCGNKVSFHKFPRDPTLFKNWIKAIRRDEGPYFKVTKYTVVCSVHFKPSDFIPGVASGHNLLRDKAIPSVFSFGRQRKCLKVSKQRTVHLRARLEQQQAYTTDTVGPPSDDEREVQDIARHTACSEATPVEQDSLLKAELESLKCLVAKQQTQLDTLACTCDTLKKELATTKAELYKCKRKMTAS
uniref:Putative tick transposon n=1 Tax=Amblyomma sculptum TaxID=1581419 RepID=A0A1E1XN30_AMBSC